MIPPINTDNGAAARADEMDQYISEGVGEWLREAAALVPNQNWSELMLCDAADLSLFTRVEGVSDAVSVKLFARNLSGMQVEVRRHGGGTNHAMRGWMREHCNQLEYECRRADGVFFPDQWVRNLAPTPEEAARRVTLLIKWLRATSRTDLAPDDLTELLSVIPERRRQRTIQR